MRAAPLCITLTLLAACAPPPVDPAVIDHNASGLGVRRELMRVPAPAPPPNPVTGVGTPDALNAVTVVRYRVDTGTDTPLAARAIVVLMPGFLGGAGSFDPLARALVRRSTKRDALEVWAIDRRSNALEDRAGVDAALAAQDANRIGSYYVDAAPLDDGTTFAGFHTQDALSYESEWGLVSTIDDLRAVLALVPAEQRKARVVLVGHSLGAAIVSAYASWDFDGVRGDEDLAGLVLVDGVVGEPGKPFALTQAEYETTGLSNGAFGGAKPQLTQIRQTTRFFAFPLLDVKLFPVSIGTALRAQLKPDAVEIDRPRREALELLFLSSNLPRMTNRAAFGLAFDAATCPVSIAAVNAGATDGPLVDATPLFGSDPIQKPAPSTQTFTWTEFDALATPEQTSLSDFALTWTRPGADFAEWYFPMRLALDSALAATLTLQPNDWPVTQYGVRATRGRELEVPVLVEAAGILKGDVGAYEPLRALLAPVGAGRPNAGAARDDARAFKALSHPRFSHIDPLAGADVAGSEVNAWFDALAAFAKDNTASGGVVVR
jgi:pimeloyl-ACP methyl ester carboxylesterase